MGKCLFRSIIVGSLFGLMLLTLGGCAKKSVMSEPAGETSRVKDAASAVIVSEPAAPSQATETGRVESLVGDDVAEGAGPSESLETPPSEAAGSPAGVGMAKGSRTSVGLLPVYFDFDKSVIRQDQLERLAASGRFLQDNHLVKLRIEGNCDELGTNEYNLALGERRAESARKYLLNMGIAADRLSVLSYGEERPLQSGDDEVARAENRRDDFVIVP